MSTRFFVWRRGDESLIEVGHNKMRNRVECDPESVCVIQSTRYWPASERGSHSAVNVDLSTNGQGGRTIGFGVSAGRHEKAASKITLAAMNLEVVTRLTLTRRQELLYRATKRAYGSYYGQLPKSM